jgi:hypothetical protein
MHTQQLIEKKIPIEERVRIRRLNYKLPKKLTEILDGFKWAMHFKNQSAVIVVDGRSGMGKTTISFQIGRYMSGNFNLEHVHFNPKSFLEGLTRVKKGDVIIFDEAMLLSSRAALTEINRMVVVAMSMIRSKNILVIFNVNSIFDLDKNLALSRADLLLNVYGDSLTDKGRFMAFFKGSDGVDRIKHLYINGKKFYSYARPKSNFHANFSSNFVLDEYEYERIKQEGVNTFLKNRQKPISTKWRDQRDKSILFHLKNGITQVEIAEELGISQQIVSEVKKKYRNIENQGIELDGRRKSQGIAVDISPKSRLSVENLEKLPLQSP